MLNFSKRGFTLIELVIVLGISLTILGFITINLVNFQQKVSINSIIDTLTSDIKSQQTKAMVGAGSGNSYGIYFQEDRYVLFSGQSYSSTNSSNFTSMLDANSVFTNITFPGNAVVFSKQSGEISGFVNGSNAITIKENNGSNQKTVILNKYGVIVSVN
ncbi:MAG: type II secretion system protein [Patescibacteria group bacterium]